MISFSFFFHFSSPSPPGVFVPEFVFENETFIFFFFIAYTIHVGTRLSAYILGELVSRVSTRETNKKKSHYFNNIIITMTKKKFRYIIVVIA